MRGFAIPLALLAATAVAAAEPDTPVATPPPRPRVGLALGGGGARGGAHVCVLQVLNELHVPVDVISATSMGAVVGGIYAAGVPISQIDRAMREADWIDLLDDRPAFRDLVFRRKEDA